jgi:type II secretory pathway predicted ATPase ExeA
MYAEYYGLTELPFELTPDPKYVFLTARQREALSLVQYGLFSSRPLTVLIGEAGTGKTTLIQAALGSERCRQVRAVVVNNPSLRPDDFLRLLALRFNLGPDAGQSKAVFLDRLEEHLLEMHRAGRIAALIVDEAQALSADLLEEIRLLGNIEAPSARLLPLVLAGQPELAQRLDEPALTQLKQRVTLRCELTPFTLMDTAAYIASRIEIAGGEPARLFSREAVSLIHRCSRGIPRTINVICDNALVSGMALRRRWVDQAIVAEVCRDLRLAAADPAPAAESTPAVSSIVTPHVAGAVGAPVTATERKATAFDESPHIRDEAAGAGRRRALFDPTSAGRSEARNILKLNEPH